MDAYTRIYRFSNIPDVNKISEENNSAKVAL